MYGASLGHSAAKNNYSVEHACHIPNTSLTSPWVPYARGYARGRPGQSLTLHCPGNLLCWRQCWVKPVGWLSLYKGAKREPVLVQGLATAVGLGLRFSGPPILPLRPHSHARHCPVALASAS